MNCKHGCFDIGGPWIAEDPDCPVHGVGANPRLDIHIEVFLLSEDARTTLERIR